MKKLTKIIIAFVLAMTIAPASAASHRYDPTEAIFTGLLGCGVGILGAPKGQDKATACAVVGVGSAFLIALIGDLSFTPMPGVEERTQTRWRFDGRDGKPKLVYPVSDSVRFSFGAEGKPLDYDGVGVGVKISF